MTEEEKCKYTILLDIRFESLYLPCSIDALDLVALLDKFARNEFSDLVHECMKKAYASGELEDNEGSTVLKLKD